MATRMRFKKNGKPRRGVSHRYQKCLEKSRFRAVRDSIQAADRYMERVLVKGGPVVPYYCPAHSCWHIGHDRKMGSAPARIYEAVCLSRERLRKEIRCLYSTLQLLEPTAGSLHIGDQRRSFLKVS